MLPPPIQVPNRGFFDREQEGGAELFVVSIISIVRKRFKRMAILMLRFDLSPGRLFSKLSFFFGIERRGKDFHSMIYVKL